MLFSATAVLSNVFIERTFWTTPYEGFAWFFVYFRKHGSLDIADGLDPTHRLPSPEIRGCFPNFLVAHACLRNALRVVFQRISISLLMMVEEPLCASQHSLWMQRDVLSTPVWAALTNRPTW